MDLSLGRGILLDIPEALEGQRRYMICILGLCSAWLAKWSWSTSLRIRSPRVRHETLPSRRIYMQT
jgi:hypothetical protein